MPSSGWDVASDALMIEHLIASAFDPVTHRPTPLSLDAQPPGAHAPDAVLTVVTLAHETATTHALPGRARGLDVAERTLCRDLERWAGTPGAVVAIGEAAAAYSVTTTQEEAVALRESLADLYTHTARSDGPTPLLSAAQGPSRDSADVVARAIERLVLPRATLPEQDQQAATAASRRRLWDTATGAPFGIQLRLHASGFSSAHAERAEGLLSLTRSPRYADTATALQAAVGRAVAADDQPVVWDASAALSGTGPARATLAQALVDHCPPAVWVGVSAWLAGVEDVMEALRTLRARGRRIVLTKYGSGREPLAAFDELPVDAIVLDPHLERGAQHHADDHAVHAAILQHAARNDVLALTTSRHARDLLRHPPAAQALRTPDPGGQLFERARLVGLTLRGTAALVNAGHGQGALAPRWDRYDVAAHWARSTA